MPYFEAQTLKSLNTFYICIQEACSVKTNAGLSIHDLARDSYFTLEIRDLLREQFPKSSQHNNKYVFDEFYEILEKDVKEKEENQKKKEETGKEANYELSPRTDLYKRCAIHKIIKRGDNGCDLFVGSCKTNNRKRAELCNFERRRRNTVALRGSTMEDNHFDSYLLSLCQEAAVAKTVTLGYAFRPGEASIKFFK